MPQHPKRRRGFTLIEGVVAVVLLGTALPPMMWALRTAQMLAAYDVVWFEEALPPEVIVAKGRDGKTDIWGIVVRPVTFDATKKYPVIEQIYAGPHGSFVPKTWGGGQTLESLAEIGFVLVQIDGMGTSNRSKTFHDYAWKNIADAGHGGARISCAGKHHDCAC